MPKRMHLTDAASERSSVTSQHSNAALIHYTPEVLTPKRAPAARYSTPDSISSTVAMQSENRQPSHSEEARSCKPDDSPIYKNTLSPESEAIPDTVRSTALDAAVGPNPCENGLTQPERENESHFASPDGTPANMVEIPHAEGYRHVMQGSPADPSGGLATPKPVRRSRTRPPKAQPAKRRRRTGTMDGVTATSDEEVPTHKRRSRAACDGLG